MISLAAEATEKRAHAHGKEVLALEVAPDAGELTSGVLGLGTRRDECRVERAGRGPDQHVGGDALFVEGAQHPRLQGTEAGTPGEDECGPGCAHGPTHSMRRRYSSDVRSSASSAIVYSRKAAAACDRGARVQRS